jgi:hypothetical protein
LDPLSEERWSRLAPQTHMCLKREGVQICITSLLHCNLPSGLHTMLDLYAFVPLPIVYYLNPKINVILWFESCPTKNATLTNKLQKTRDSRSLSHKRQANI